MKKLDYCFKIFNLLIYARLCLFDLLLIKAFTSNLQLAYICLIYHKRVYEASAHVHDHEVKQLTRNSLAQSHPFGSASV